MILYVSHTWHSTLQIDFRVKTVELKFTYGGYYENEVNYFNKLLLYI